MKKKTLVFGASTNSDRYSFLAINRLVSHEHEVVAYGLRKGIVAGVNIDVELRNYQGIDTVTLYMNPQRQEDYYEYLISLKPHRIIFNPGTENPKFYDLLRKNHIEFEQACTLVLLNIKQY